MSVIDREYIFRRRVGGGGNRIIWSAADLTAIRRYIERADPALIDRSARHFAGRDPIDPIWEMKQRRLKESSLQVYSMEAIKASQEGERRWPAITSTESIDRMFDRIPVNAWRLGPYQRTRSVLAFHDSGTFPVAKSVMIYTSPVALHAVAEFASEKVSPEAERAYQMIAGGFLRNTSVGFRPLSWEFAADQKARPLGMDFKAVELIEWSVTPTPANVDCIIGPSFLQAKAESGASQTPIRDEMQARLAARQSDVRWVDSELARLRGSARRNVALEEARALLRKLRAKRI
jgi:hypothetical protein